MQFIPERDSQIYPSLSPEEQARYREMAEQHMQDRKPEDFIGEDRFLTPDEMWQLQEDHRKALEYMLAHMRKPPDGGEQNHGG